MDNHKNYRVVEGQFRNVFYFATSADAERFAKYYDELRIECYVYGYGWVRWCESMREVTV